MLSTGIASLGFTAGPALNMGAASAVRASAPIMADAATATGRSVDLSMYRNIGAYPCCTRARDARRR